MPRSSRVPSRLRSALGVALAVSAAAACTPNAAVTPPVGTPSATPTSIASTVPVSGESPSASPSAAVSATPSAATTWKVSGTVLDDERNPVAAASVKAMAGAKEAGSASTDALGKYQLALPPGDYVLVAAKDNFTRREQPLKLAADATADFGPVTPDSGNPYFLSNFPEIVSVDVQEAGTGGPLTLKARLSEPLPAASQKSFESAVEIYTSKSIEFLRSTVGGEYRSKPTVTWEDAGQTFVFAYPGPYLASGAVDVFYSLGLRQRQLDTKDPVTREPEWEDLKITDEGGAKLGRGRVAYAFKKDKLETIPGELLVNFTWGYTPEARRWNLTHEGLFTWKAAKDEVKPKLLSAEMAANQLLGSVGVDILTLRFSEPMAVAKDREHLVYTQLDREKELVILNVSKNENGSSPVPAEPGLKAQKIEFDLVDPRTVYLYYGGGVFDKLKWIEVTMGADAKDPAGNKFDPAKSKASGAITGTTT